MWVVLVVEGCGDAEVSEEDGAVVVDEEVGGFDVAVDEAVYVEVADWVGSAEVRRREGQQGERRGKRGGRSEEGEARREKRGGRSEEKSRETHLRPWRAWLRMQRTTSSCMPPGQA